MVGKKDEIEVKLRRIREVLAHVGAQGARLRGNDWVSWVMGGADVSVLLAAECGVAEILVTSRQAWIVTDEIEAKRISDEEASPSFEMAVFPWASGREREAWLSERVEKGRVLSDRPQGPSEAPLPPELRRAKCLLLPSEQERYRDVGKRAAEAMSEVLQAATPHWTEVELAGAGAAALWKRGLHPALTLAAGERRFPLYRHPTAKPERIGNRAMLVFCARGAGLYANLTRFVAFTPLTNEEKRLHGQVRDVEAAALAASVPGAPLSNVVRTLTAAYERAGFPRAIREHHQGGTTGYLAREVVATPETPETLAAGMAVAWNPSLPGAKVEDTFLVGADGALENLTLAPGWPTVDVAGRKRPDVLQV